eukprot:scaffold81692_cov36-Phaeocystis_antarctica.AAC.1
MFCRALAHCLTIDAAPRHCAPLLCRLLWAVVVARVGAALLRGSSIEVLQRPRAQAPARRGREGHTGVQWPYPREGYTLTTRCWNPLRGRRQPCPEGPALCRSRAVAVSLPCRSRVVAVS